MRASDYIFCFVFSVFSFMIVDFVYILYYTLFMNEILRVLLLYMCIFMYEIIYIGCLGYDVHEHGI